MKTTNIDAPIENNIPVPDHTGGGRPPIYPFGKLEIGESVLIEIPAGKSPATIFVSAYATGRRENKKFVCRTQDGGVRVWRVALKKDKKAKK